MVWAALVLLLFLMDLVSKTYIRNNIDLFDRIPVIRDFFYITHVENTGAAWGILKNGRYFFIIITFIISAFLIYYFIKNDNKILRIALSFILAGAFGNLYDRVFYGRVTDFLDFLIFGYDYPVFNVADICINVGTWILVIYILFIYKDPSKKAAVETSNESEV